MSNKSTNLRIVRARKNHAKARRSGRLRLLVFKSNRTINAYVIDDSKGKILYGISGLKMKGTGMEVAKQVGTEIAKKANSNKVKEVSFDRNGYLYHGQIKSLADAAREGGLKF